MLYFNIRERGSAMSTIDAEARDKVSKDELYRSVDYLCSLGEKVSGFTEEEKACGYIVEKLKEYGYEPTVHEFDSYLSYPRSAQLTVGEGADAFELPCVGV